MKAGETWRDGTSGAVGTIVRFEGDHVIVKFRDGGMATRVQRDTLLTHWTRWPKKLDVDTQERLREILRLTNVQIPPECLAKPIHVLSLYPITGGVGASPAQVQRQAERNAQTRPWGIDIGTYRGGLDETQAVRIKRTCEEEGIPFWDKQWTGLHQILKNPMLFPEQYQEICETFGTPVPAVADD